MKNVHIYAYNPASESSKSLAGALGIKRISHNNSRYRGAAGKSVINWGASTLPEEVRKSTIINPPELVATCVNKRTFFQNFSDRVSCPEYTTDKDVVRAWLKNKKTAFARTKLTGSGGDGIVVIEKENDIVDAPLYTLYIPKISEWRVHIFMGEVILIQKKGTQQGVKPNNNDYRIQNTANGFIFLKNLEDTPPPNCVLDVAMQFNDVSGLDFFAADIIYNKHREAAYMLEVNTAPGLAGTTVDTYAEAFINYLNRRA